MMPLSMVNKGTPITIMKVGGKEETRRFLENLGFVAGSQVTVVSEIGGNMIVNVKESRVAIGRDMANKIMVA
ncbi:MAG: FeoA family protein [Clostridium sp.]|nr:FeoA family protein [Clostridium sp.]